MQRRSLWFVAVVAPALLLSRPAHAQEAEPGDPGEIEPIDPVGDPPAAIGSLKGVPVPEPAELASFVRDRQAAIALGKALFWDSQVGSNGQACASCHYHAGADHRVKNQLNPGINSGDTAFSTLPSGERGGPNYTLTMADYPFHQLVDPLNRSSDVVYDTNDVSASAGTFDGGFVSSQPFLFPDICGAPDTSVFAVNGIAVRKVEPRNTPTAINAAFNYRNFWDGRANNTFNGVSPFGPRDPGAHVMAIQADGSVAPVTVALENAALASQSVGPPTSNNEMSCLGRTFADIGHRMYERIPLETQLVASDDSVLGGMRGLLGIGLDHSYKQLVQQAFDPKYWNSSTQVTLSGKTYSVMEANFSLFWGLAIQLYEETLISDDAPIDQLFDGDPTALTDQELRGMGLFQGVAGCINCHNGPQFTAAASQLQAQAAEQGLIEEMFMNAGPASIYDAGFYNTGVRPSAEDVGVGGLDPFGNPLSFTRQYRASLNGLPLIDNFAVDPCSFKLDPCSTSDFPDAVDGAFKTPGLRNIELTGPYFHNGGAATLEQVVEFYSRGGDRRGPDGLDSSGLGVNGTNLDADMEVLGLTPGEQADLVAFLKRPLTDDRVRWERAPFDHPSLVIPNGQMGDQNSAVDLNHDGKAEDLLLVLPPIGKNGRTVQQGPLMPFLQ